NGFRLGQWVRVQRTKADTMSASRRQRFDELGFDWDPRRETAWEEGFRHLVLYKEREGDCLVPLRHKENGHPVGQWVRVQRSKTEIISTLRRQRLDELGFVWDALNADWQKGFRHLTIYKEREGDCLVPVKHKENGFPLGPWVVNQRHRINTLSEARRQHLD